jgi:transcriptional regulator with GAF, ATPase, and Fis domain
LARRDGPSFQAGLAKLGQAGVELHPLQLGAGLGPGLLVFDEMSKELYDFVREASRDGHERVLAVAFGSAPLVPLSTWRLLEAGASDVFDWDHSAAPELEIAARFQRWEAVDRLVRSPGVWDRLVGESSAWRSVLREIVEIAAFSDASVLITGESGTGKELVARLIHQLDRREGKRDLVLVDCATVVPSLSGSEFFGHERGSFTGAVAARDGAFALADGGTLFLDEVGELPLALQAELLRVVQEGTYKRVGSNTWRRTGFRLICATNRDLLQEATGGTFRRDFYYRIAAWRCRLPSLRERSEDILPLVSHFLRQLHPDQKPPELDQSVREFLLAREYPGNIRDLRQLTARLARRHVGPGPITAGAVPSDERPPAEVAVRQWPDAAFEASLRRALAVGVNLKEIGQAARETAIRTALAMEEGNLQRASRTLGITDRALQMRRAARLGASRAQHPFDEHAGRWTGAGEGSSRRDGQAR